LSALLRPLLQRLAAHSVAGPDRRPFGDRTVRGPRPISRVSVLGVRPLTARAILWRASQTRWQLHLPPGAGRPALLHPPGHALKAGRSVATVGRNGTVSRGNGSGCATSAGAGSRGSGVTWDDCGQRSGSSVVGLVRVCRAGAFDLRAAILETSSFVAGQVLDGVGEQDPGSRFVHGRARLAGVHAGWCHSRSALRGCWLLVGRR
jgi:hypothetical protein